MNIYKLKAEELIATFMWPHRRYESDNKLKVAKEGALLCVEELLNTVSGETLAYWQKVKEELKNWQE